jgi:hypothetical protein
MSCAAGNSTGFALSVTVSFLGSSVLVRGLIVERSSSESDRGWAETGLRRIDGFQYDVKKLNMIMGSRSMGQVTRLGPGSC